MTEMTKRVERESWAAPVGLVVEARDGMISLWGLASSEAERDALVTMARAIDGCRGVDSHIAVRKNIPYAYGI
jgi:osmotically-inducible protein OsmY